MNLHEIINVLENEREENKNTYADYQIQEIATIVDSFVNKKRQKILVADEVGLGKTYVAQGVMRMLKETQEKRGLSVYYFAPNESVLRENVGTKLLKGISDEQKDTSSNRPVLQLVNSISDKTYKVYGSTPGISFGDNSRYGTKEERKVVCAALQVALSNTEYEKILPILYSMLYLPEQTGDESRRDYYVIRDSFGNERPYTWAKERYEYITWLNEIAEYAEKQKWAFDRKEHKEFFWKNIQSRAYPQINIIIDLLRNNYDAYKALVSGIHVETPEQIDQNRIVELYLTNEGKGWPPEKKFEEICQEYKTSLIELKCAYLLGVPFADCFKNGNTVICFEEEVRLFFKQIRALITAFVFQNIQPDLIILDEFHRYLDPDEKKGIENVLNVSPNTKILLLSATPYSTDLDGIEFDCTNKKYEVKQAFTDFASVLGYLNVLQGTEEEQTLEWSGKLNDFYEKVNKLLQKATDNEKGTDWEILWKDAVDAKNNIEKELKGVVIRTERYMAMKQFDKDYIIDYNIEYNKIDALDKNILRKFVNEYISTNQSDYQYLLDTPYYLSFVKDYKIGKATNQGSQQLENLFISEKISDDENERACQHKKFGALMKSLDMKRMSKLLWLPPVNPSTPLAGVFEGSENDTKTLVFCRYVMSTRAIATLISRSVESYEIQGCKSENELLEISEALRQEIQQFEIQRLQNGESFVKKVKGAYKLEKALQTYFTNHISVLLRGDVRNLDELYQYCNDGCLLDVIQEYMELDVENHTVEALTDPMGILMCDGMDIRYQSREQWKEKSVLIDKTQMYKKERCHFAMRLTDDYNDGGEANANGIERVKKYFLSPFWPFVLATTAIAQEGVDLHYYCHQIYHWNIPISPIEFDQREGRINRRNSHLIRKRAKDVNKESMEYKEAVKQGNGMIPNWYIPRDALFHSEEAPMATRIVSYYPLSKEKKRYDLLKATLHSYRLSLGCGIDFDEVNNFYRLCDERGKDPMELLLHLSPAFC